MGSFKLIFIILPFLTFGQRSEKVNDALHFYGSVAINETSYQIQGLVFPKMKETPKVLISNGITLLAIFGKEFYDTKKKNPTGFSWDDALTGCWSVPIYDIVNICRFDYKRRTKDGYYK